MEHAAITNREVGDRIGLTHSSVSRLRCGSRGPSFDTMCRIVREFDWTISQQIVAKTSAEGYGHHFEKVLIEVYGATSA